MAKEFKKWIDEFVENGADAKDVTNWPENAGGGSSIIEVPANSRVTLNANKLLQLLIAKKVAYLMWMLELEVLIRKC